MADQSRIKERREIISQLIGREHFGESGLSNETFEEAMRNLAEYSLAVARRRERPEEKGCRFRIERPLREAFLRRKLEEKIERAVDLYRSSVREVLQTMEENLEEEIARLVPVSPKKRSNSESPRPAKRKSD